MYEFENATKKLLVVIDVQCNDSFRVVFHRKYNKSCFVAKDGNYNAPIMVVTTLKQHIKFMAIMIIATKINGSY
jgi:hypothetical protein